MRIQFWGRNVARGFGIFVAVIFLQISVWGDAKANVARNIDEQGLFTQSSVGQTYYMYRGVGDYPAVRVISVDLDRRQAFVDIGAMGTHWVKVRHLYTYDQMRAAKQAENAAAGAVAVGAGALLFCALTDACGRGGKPRNNASDGCWRYTGCPGSMNVNKQLLDQCLYWNSTGSAKDGCLRQYCSDRYFDYGCNDK
jgi:hypothetical protein